MIRKAIISGLLAFTFFLSACKPPEILPAETSASPASQDATVLSAEIIETQGEVDAQLASSDDFIPAQIGMLLSAVSQIKTGVDGRSRLDLINGTIVRVGPQSHFSLEEIEEAEQGTFAQLKMTFGQIWVILNGGDVEIETPSGLAGIRG
ncbi:MAG: hypothetical protein HN855_08575 [Anaerolineae bacterium]|nr:hypothetical protein [Anaerolineae bacterium]MBT7071672.1 hypothetical protein [Anaerolineae bacterium]MBT7325198.1 hypothetical protein [Anaerolineae bacterium]